MKSWAFALLAPLLFGLGACTPFNRAVDRPVEVDKGYQAREDVHREDDDRCGPAFLQDSLPKGLVSLVGPLGDGPFRPVCQRHDACYRLKEETQSWCDDRMRDEMIAICDTGKSTPFYSVPVIGPSLCRFHAGIYYTAINSTFGAAAYEGPPGGEIVDVRIKYIDDRLTADELNVCVDVKNPTLTMQEYDVELHTSKGDMVDREPDTYERNVRPGKTREFCVGTNYSPMWDAGDLTDVVYVSVRADTPTGFAVTNDMVIVDTREVRVRPDAP